MRKLGLVIAAAAMVGFAGSAWAGHNTGPSSKATFTHADVNIVQEIDITALDVQIENPDVGAFPEALYDGGARDAVCSQIELDAGLCIPGAVLDALSASAWTILQTTIKMPKHKDISIDVSFECGNFLDTHVKSKGGQKDSASAAATVRVAVMVDDGINDPSFAFPNVTSALGDALTGDGNADENDTLIQALSQGVVFCHKSQLLEATFQGLIQEGDPFTPFELTVDFGADEGLVGNLYELELDCLTAGDATVGTPNTCVAADFEVVGTCLIQLADGQIVLRTACLTPEELRLVTGSMTANAFNFLYHNAQESSVHTITVIAWLDTGAALGGTTLGSASAKATIGLGSMQVETIRLVKQDDAALVSGAPICLDGC